MTGGADVLVWRGRALTPPAYGADGIARILDADAGRIVYLGPGRAEVKRGPRTTI
jgi:hypothetical protein